MSSLDADLDTPTAATPRCQNNCSVSVRLCDSFRPDEDREQYAAEAPTPRVTIRGSRGPVELWANVRGGL
ncbi:hypothetical protein [Streptomyces sp. NBC_00083]|uniref:hypothetical protein n=1 Tax=Streptomyces sp. NBC_00083 TaxID=2975647 RepID=UPI00225263BC|nr:hypothetical protein [Streptomyces sp. NBC_00083]MCX5384748.1 hypothetical protein [Streptomyces sp. NBC_00083]